MMRMRRASTGSVTSTEASASSPPHSFRPKKLLATLFHHKAPQHPYGTSKVELGHHRRRRYAILRFRNLRRQQSGENLRYRQNGSKRNKLRAWTLIFQSPLGDAGGDVDERGNIKGYMGHDMSKLSNGTFSADYSIRDDTVPFPTPCSPSAMSAAGGPVGDAPRLLSALLEEEEDDGGRGDAVQAAKVQEACRKFERYLVKMVVDEGNVNDLLDVEELLASWSQLTCPVFLHLVARFYAEICMDLFPTTTTDSDDGTTSAGLSETQGNTSGADEDTRDGQVM